MSKSTRLVFSLGLTPIRARPRRNKLGREKNSVADLSASAATPAWQTMEKPLSTWENPVE